MSICEQKEAFKGLLDYANKNPAPVQNRTIKDDIKEAEILYSNAKFYYASNEFNGALVSYSCAAVLLNSIIRQLTDPLKTRANNILNCCLSAVQILQEKVKTSGGSTGQKDEEKKDWGKICTNLQPLVFSKGSSDCLFFSSVAGLRKEKELFRTSLIFPLSYPNLYPKASKGILIYGPPGTGKTYIVKAAVNELQKTDPNVGVLFFAPSPGDLKGKYVGETEKKIEEWFTCASRAACESQLECPGQKKFISLIFMDEFDAIAPDRNTDSTGLAANSVNTLLQMMDGIKSKENVAVVAATNFPWYLDSAILRRFDTQILIDLPKSGDITELLNIEMKKIIKFRDIKDPDAYCKSEKKKDSQDSSADKTQKNLNCTLECVEEVPIDLTTIAPYNQMIFDYYDTSNNSTATVAGIVHTLEEKHFSNSDVSRLIKAAATYTGQLCVKNNLFYSSRVLNDYTGDDKYISCITKLKNEKKAIQYSIDILNSYMNQGANQLPANFYQLDKPKIVKVMYGDESFINIKCFFYKDNELNLDDPLIKDIYIQFDMSNISVDNYKTQILNKRVFDAIITFDFSIKETEGAVDNETLLPVSSDLINAVFKPMYTVFQDAKNTYEEFEKANAAPARQITVGGGPEEAQRWAKKYKLDQNDIGELKNDKMFNLASNAPSFLSSSLQKILRQNLPIVTSQASKMITGFDLNNYIYYSDWLFKYAYNELYNLDKPVKNELPYNITTYLKSISNYDKTKIVGVNDVSNNMGNIVPFTINNTLTNEDVIFYLDIAANNFLLGFTQYYAFVPYLDIGDEFKNEKDMYIEIEVPLFVLLFKKYFDISKVKELYKSKTGKDLKEKAFNPSTDYTDVNQVLIQLYFNDVFNFYELCKIRGGPDPKTILKAYLNGFEKIGTPGFNVTGQQLASSSAQPTYTETATPGLLTKELLNLISKRIHDNYDYVRFGKIFVLNKADDGNGKYTQAITYPVEPVATVAPVVQQQGPAPTNAPVTGPASGPGPTNAPTAPATAPATAPTNAPGSGLGSSATAPAPVSKKADWVNQSGFLTGSAKNDKLGIVLNSSIMGNISFTDLNGNPLTPDFLHNNEAVDKFIFDNYKPQYNEIMQKNKSIGGGTAKNRNANSHNKTSKNKGKPAKKQKQSKRLLRGKKAKVEEEVLEEVVVQHGGEPIDDEQKALISFCLNTNKPNVVKKIINKKIYIKTKIDLDKFIEQKRNSLLLGLWTTFSTWTNDAKNYFMNKTPEQINAEKQTLSAKMINDLKIKNQYLPLIFKEISAFGFAEDKPDILNNANNANYTVKDDDDLDKQQITVRWITISESQIFGPMTSVITNLISSVTPDADTTVAGVGAVSTLVGLGAYVWSGITNTKFTAVLANLLGSSLDWVFVSGQLAIFSQAYLLGYSISEVYNIYNQDEVKPEYILKSYLLTSIFSTITDIRYIEVNSLNNTTASQLFLKNIKTDFIKVTDQMNILTKGLSTVINSSRNLLFENKAIGDQTAPYPIMLYENAIPEPKDMKSRLTNLNIPFTSFYYALSVVQSTYVKETGDMLTQYYNNKDKFMEDYKKKQKK